MLHDLSPIKSLYESNNSAGNVLCLSSLRFSPCLSACIMTSGEIAAVLIGCVCLRLLLSRSNLCRQNSNISFLYPGQTKCWRILYLSWCRDYKKVRNYVNLCLLLKLNILLILSLIFYVFTHHLYNNKQVSFIPHVHLLFPNLLNFLNKVLLFPSKCSCFQGF